jgi:hypothetical protein
MDATSRQQVGMTTLLTAFTKPRKAHAMRVFESCEMNAYSSDPSMARCSSAGASKHLALSLAALR